jgi:hypothetical protein
MDYVRALELREISLEQSERFIKMLVGDNVPPQLRERYEAERLAIVAIKKQIPEPVKYLNRHGDGSDLWNKDYFNCPACGRRLRNKKPDPYCPRCGQAITWEVRV